MIKYNKKKRLLTFTGKDFHQVNDFAKAHDMTFREVVYEAIRFRIFLARKKGL